MMKSAHAMSDVTLRTWFHMPQDDWNRFHIWRPSLERGVVRVSARLSGALRSMVTENVPMRKRKLPASR